MPKVLLKLILSLIVIILDVVTRHLGMSIVLVSSGFGLRTWKFLRSRNRKANWKGGRIFCNGLTLPPVHPQEISKVPSVASATHQQH